MHVSNARIIVVISAQAYRQLNLWLIVGINWNHFLHCWIDLWSYHITRSCNCLLLCYPRFAVWPGAAKSWSGAHVCKHKETNSKVASVQVLWNAENSLCDCRLPAKFCARQSLPGTLGQACHTTLLSGLYSKLGVTTRSCAARRGFLSYYGFAAVFFVWGGCGKQLRKLEYVAFG